MAWIESHQSLRDHPKTKRLCGILRLDGSAVVGNLHYLWWWAIDYRMDGVLTGLNDTEIAEAAGYRGDSKSFVDALVKAGFLDRRDGVLTIHDWRDYCGNLVSKRLERLADKRRKMADNIRQTAGNGGKCPPTVPNHTEPNPTKQGKRMVCPDCKGNGEIGAAGHQRTCWTCQGKGTIWREDYELLKNAERHRISKGDA